jgi:hypothetical protein
VKPKPEEDTEFLQDEVLASEFVGVQMCNLLLFPMLQKFSESGGIDEATWVHFLDVDPPFSFFSHFFRCFKI